MDQTCYPSLYQINTRVWLNELSKELGRHATLDDISDIELDRIANHGFDWIWFLSVWCTGEKGRKISRENPMFRHDFEETLPDLKEDDIAGSGFAIADYRVHPDLGGDAALARLREKLAKRGMKLMLDFVPNHMGPDHPWIENHPGYFISGTESDLLNFPRNFARVNTPNGDLILAYGRDPYFDGWPDTFQVDYSNPDASVAMKNELLRISEQCDGVRCDMAMLLLPDVFERTWGRKSQPFWHDAIKAVKEKVPDFCFLAEVYWDMEWIMQQQGFDYAYDKRLYDRLCAGHARHIREHFFAGISYQDKLARFLENHDEPRAALTFDRKRHEAAAVLTFLSPGLKFFHQGQFEGKRIHISPHLVRAPFEQADTAINTFYNNLLTILKRPEFREGTWLLLECFPAWHGNESWDSFIAFRWKGALGEKSLVIVNYAPYSSQCYTSLCLPDLEDLQVRFTDLTGPSEYLRDGNQLMERGVYFDLPPWGYHVFQIDIL
jgi:glycosidase